LISGKLDSHGTGGVDRIRRLRTSNGVTPTQARPSYVSSRSWRGTTAASAPGGTLQCANSRSIQDWAITHDRVGAGHGRWLLMRAARSWITGETRASSALRAASTAMSQPSLHV
jgi:hypothetical protein